MQNWFFLAFLFKIQSVIKVGICDIACTNQERSSYFKTYIFKLQIASTHKAKPNSVIDLSSYETKISLSGHTDKNTWRRWIFSVEKLSPQSFNPFFQLQSYWKYAVWV